jgi:hypothetical protein
MKVKQEIDSCVSTNKVFTKKPRISWAENILVSYSSLQEILLAECSQESVPLHSEQKF